MGGDGTSSITFSENTFRWIFLPPFTAFLTLLTASFFSSGASIPVDTALWGLVGLLFIVLTVLYGLFIRQEFFKGLFPVQLIAQGLLLCPFSLHMGAPMFQWVGVTMTVCGAVVLVVLYYRSRYSASSRLLPTPAPSELNLLPLPFAITDGEGNITSASDALLMLTRQTRLAVEGKKITLLLPLDQEIIAMGGKDWRILQSPMEDNMYYFQLEEVRDAAVTLPSHSEDAGTFVDPTTSLYNRLYAIKRVSEELYRIRRYQRWMSAVLLRMIFRGTEAQPAKEDEIFNAYCRFVRASTREADITCLVGPRDILVVMPETPLEGAKEVASKLADFVPHLQEQFAGFDGAAEIKEGVAFFASSSGDLSFDQVLDKLDEDLAS